MPDIPERFTQWADRIPAEVRATLDPVTVLARAMAAERLEKMALAAHDRDLWTYYDRQARKILQARPAAEVRDEIEDWRAKAAAVTDHDLAAAYRTRARDADRDNPLPDVDIVAKAAAMLRTTVPSTRQGAGGRYVRSPTGSVTAAPPDTAPAATPIHVKYDRLAETVTDRDLQKYYRDKAADARNAER